MRLRLLCCSVLFLITALPAAAQQPRGSLFILGGGPRPDSLMQHFIELAGGDTARVLVLPMAAANAQRAGEDGVKEFERKGIRARYLVIDSSNANGSGAAAQMAWATGVWFPGGVQSRITRAMGGTAAERALHELHRRGGVIGGTSAGAAVMSAVMITGSERRLGGRRPPGDSTQAFITIDRDNVVTERGLGLVGDVIVDQHFVRRRRHNRLLSLVLESQTRVGVGIDEGTAVIVGPDGRWRVVGESVAVIYDARNAPAAATGVLGAAGLRLHVLPAGGWFDSRTGEAGTK